MCPLGDESGEGFCFSVLYPLCKLEVAHCPLFPCERLESLLSLLVIIVLGSPLLFCFPEKLCVDALRS